MMESAKNFLGLYIISPNKMSVCEDSEITKIHDDIQFLKKDAGYWRYILVDYFLRVLVPLTNACVKKLLALHTYCALKVGTTSHLGTNLIKCNEQEITTKSAGTLIPMRTKFTHSLRVHRLMATIPCQAIENPHIFQPLRQSCTIDILAEPMRGSPIRADIVFIHGLHGSVVKTWRQGLGCDAPQTFAFQRHSKSSYNFNKMNKRSHSLASENFLNETSDLLTNNYESNILQCLNESVVYTNNEQYSRCWPGDWIPIDCPGVRVMAVNYSTEDYMWRPLWIKSQLRPTMDDRVREMMELLIAHGVGFGRPIIWVGHSKGGLFIKQLIVEAWESSRPAASPLWRSTRGIIFYSVPHRGSSLAAIRAPLLARSTELLEVEKDNAHIMELHRRFLRIYNLGHLNIEVVSFVETALTLLSVFYLRIVDFKSADIGIGDIVGIHLDHREICKPRSRNCILYTKLVEMIKKNLLNYYEKNLLNYY